MSRGPVWQGLSALLRRVRDEVPVSAAARRRQFRLRRFAGPYDHAERHVQLRVAHLTDLHVGTVTPIDVHRTAVALTNEARPDLVVVTGDFVCHSQLHLDALAEVIGAIDAPVIGVLGNHDYYAGADEVRRSLRRAGAEVLDNAHTTITLRHQRLQVVGVDDAYTGHADVGRALRGLRPDLPVLGLSHIPEEADALWAGGVPLVLAGHTHAGQVTYARLQELTIGRLVGHKYVHGLYGKRRPLRDGPAAGPDGAVYVGAGVGASVVPWRLGERARREVTVFELGAEPDDVDETYPEQAPLPGRKPSPVTRRRRAEALARKVARRQRRQRP